jgi:hypothetical protein
MQFQGKNTTNNISNTKTPTKVLSPTKTRPTKTRTELNKQVDRPTSTRKVQNQTTKTASQTEI